MGLHFRWTSEDEPGVTWRRRFERAWPSYRAWFLREGSDARPDLETCRARLADAMPEMVPLWERLCDEAGADDEAARMLSLYRPTPFMSGCTQAVVGGSAPALVRNYDYHPHRCEATFARTTWAGTTVVASLDCLWGVLDGINEHGLTVALSFGGTPEVGDGFGIPLILRYVLETCTNVAEACAVLRRVPSHMTYSVSVVDAAGDYALVYLRPGAATEVVDQAVSANHQHRIEWSAYASSTRSVEREERARAALAEASDVDALVEAFLEPPLFATEYARWFGTLYTVAYRPGERSVEVVWPGAAVHQTVDDFRERELEVPYPVDDARGVG